MNNQRDQLTLEQFIAQMPQFASDTKNNFREFQSNAAAAASVLELCRERCKELRVKCPESTKDRVLAEELRLIGDMMQAGRATLLQVDMDLDIATDDLENYEDAVLWLKAKIAEPKEAQKH